MESLNEILSRLEELEKGNLAENLDEYKQLVQKAQNIKEQQELQSTVKELKSWAEKPKVTWTETVVPDVAVDEKSWIEVGQVKYRIPVGTLQKGYDKVFEAYMVKGLDYMSPSDRKQLQEGLDPAGGFLVPPDTMGSLLKKIAAMSTIRQFCRVITTSRDSVPFPVLNYTADDIYTSTVRLTWTGELPATSTEHRAAGLTSMFGLKKIDVHTAMASAPVSNDLLEDSAVDVAGLLTSLFGEAFALGEDEAFINGTGIRQPRGILQEAGADIAAVPSGNASSLTADGLIDLYYALPAQYRRNARWVMNSPTQKVIEKLKDSSNRYIVSSLMSASLQTGEFDNLKGKPIVLDEFMPDCAANAYPILFGDFTGYVIADRTGLSIQRLSEVYAELNTTLFLARKRVGGMTLEPWRFRVQKCATS